MSEDIIQGSAEWLALRCGKVTASRVADVVAKTKSGYSTSRSNYMAELVIERMTGQPAPKYVSPEMQWGTNNEADARIAYEFQTDATVQQIGFVMHPQIDDCGASPDGLIGDYGMVEIKCPNTATHIETLLGQSVPGRYDTQIQWQLACAGRKWCDFVSFDPRMPEAMQLFIKRVERDDKRIVELETEVAGFLLGLEAKIFELNKIYGLEEAA